MKVSLNLFALLIAFFILLQSVSFLLIEAEFSFNHSFIAATLCENRSKPDLHCDGKCYLIKEISKEQQQQNSSKQNIRPVFSFLLFYEETNNVTYHHSLMDFFLPQQALYVSQGFSEVTELPPGCLFS